MLIFLNSNNSVNSFEFIINFGSKDNKKNGAIKCFSDTITNSLGYLKSIPTRKKGKPSKHIKKVLEDMKSHPEVFSKVSEIDIKLRKISKMKMMSK